MMTDSELNNIKTRIKELKEISSPEHQIIESKQKIGQIYSNEPFLEHLYEEQQYNQLAVIELNTIRKMLESVIPDLKASILHVAAEVDDLYQPVEKNLLQPLPDAAYSNEGVKPNARVARQRRR